MSHTCKGQKETDTHSGTGAGRQKERKGKGRGRGESYQGTEKGEEGEVKRRGTRRKSGEREGGAHIVTQPGGWASRGAVVRCDRCVPAASACSGASPSVAAPHSAVDTVPRVKTTRGHIACLHMGTKRGKLVQTSQTARIQEGGGGHAQCHTCRRQSRCQCTRDCIWGCPTRGTPARGGHTLHKGEEEGHGVASRTFCPRVFDRKSSGHVSEPRNTSSLKYTKKRERPGMR